MSTSIDDGVIELDDDNGIDVLLFDNDTPGLASRLSTQRGNRAIDLDDDNGIDVLHVDNDSPGLGTRLSSSINNGVIELDDEDGINGIVDLNDEGGIDVIPSEPPGVGCRLSTSTVIDLDDEADGIDDTSSEPPGFGSHVSTSSDNSNVIDLDGISSEPPGLGFRLSTSICHHDLERASWPTLDSERPPSVYFDCHRQRRRRRRRDPRLKPFLHSHLFYCRIQILIRPTSRGGPKPEIDPYERYAHHWCEPKAMRLERKEKRFFGSSWIKGRSRETGQNSFTSALVANMPGLAGVRKALMVWLVPRRY